jgi:hypothetical protein
MNDIARELRDIVETASEQLSAITESQSQRSHIAGQ